MAGFFDKADVEITVPDKVLMGDKIDCIVKVSPKSDALLRKIEMELYCQETAISRGKTDTYFQKKVYSEERSPEKDIRITKGQVLEYNEVFQLPALCTPTMFGHNHQVEWFFRVRLDVPLWPDTREEVSLKVLPAIPAMASGEEYYAE